MRWLEKDLTSLPRMVRGLFAYKVEDSLSLRLIVLAMGLWVALSLG